jgi:hypothetical protein
MYPLYMIVRPMGSIHSPPFMSKYTTFPWKYYVFHQKYHIFNEKHTLFIPLYTDIVVYTTDIVVPLVVKQRNPLFECVYTTERVWGNHLTLRLRWYIFHYSLTFLTM